MPYRKRVKPGDVVAIPLGPQAVAVALVLHKSGDIRTGIVVGYYDKLFSSVDEIHIATLGGPFIGVPNYTFTRPIWHEEWKVIGNSPELLAATQLPILRIVAHLYDGDEVVGHIALEDFHKYIEAGFAYQGFVENMLRKHFTVGNG